MQVVSHYYYHKHSSTDRFHQLAVNNPLERWVEISLDGQNVQVQFISGHYGLVNDTVYADAVAHLQSVRRCTARQRRALRARLTQWRCASRERGANGGRPVWVCRLV